MKCTNCGRDIRESDTFCPYCGEQLSYNDGYPRDPGRQNGYGQAASPSGYRSESVAASSKGSFSGIAVIVVIILLLLAVLGIMFWLLHNRTPDPEDMTYDELIAEYGLVRDDGDSVKTAYNDGVRIEFEDISRGNSGYRATALIFTPDMEKIYDRTTDPDGIINQLERTSDDDLQRTKKLVLIEGKSRLLSQNSAEDLRELIDHQFVTISEYNSQKQVAAESSAPADSSSDSGNTTSNTYNNYTYNVEAPPSNSGTPEPETSTPSAPSVSDAGYIIPDSSSRYISSSELNGLSRWQCCIARNEIYARHGRMFERDDLQSYFDGCSWYTPTVAASSFNENVLNSYEKKNIQTIKAYEQAHGYL